MEIRTDELTGVDVAITASRQDRPDHPAAHDCPFCVGGLEAPTPYDVRWFVNRWPTFPHDRCEVVLFSPLHDASLATLSPESARALVDVWAERSAALGTRDDVAYVLVFENRGSEVGATIPHPHGQIYGYEAVPARPRRVFEQLAGGAKLLEDDDRRTVIEAAAWRAWVPAATGYPFGMRVAPVDAVPDLPSLDTDGRRGLALVLTDVLRRLDRLFGEPMPYMLWCNQRPFDGSEWPGAHAHFEIAPVLRARGVQRFVAAAELASGMYVNPVTPEDAAERLRRANP